MPPVGKLNLCSHVRRRMNEETDATMAMQGCDSSPVRHHVHHYRAIFSGGRIVVVAIEQQLIDRRSDLVFRRFDQTETQVARRIFDAVEVTREFSLRRRNVDRARVRKLVRRLILVITKANGSVSRLMFA